VNVNGGKCPEFTLDIPTANLPVSAHSVAAKFNIRFVKQTWMSFCA
jgi:hypothetical protein